MPEISVRVIRNEFPRIASGFEGNVADAINVGVFDLVAAADPITPVDKGDLKAHKQLDMASAGNLHATVTWTMYYAGFVNDGTVHMSGRHYADGAADATFPGTIANIQRAAVGGLT